MQKRELCFRPRYARRPAPEGALKETFASPQDPEGAGRPGHAPAVPPTALHLVRPSGARHLSQPACRQAGPGVAVRQALLLWEAIPVVTSPACRQAGPWRNRRSGIGRSAAGGDAGIFRSPNCSTQLTAGGLRSHEGSEAPLRVPPGRLRPATDPVVSRAKRCFKSVGPPAPGTGRMLHAKKQGGQPRRGGDWLVVGRASNCPRTWCAHQVPVTLLGPRRHSTGPLHGRAGKASPVERRRGATLRLCRIEPRSRSLRSPPQPGTPPNALGPNASSRPDPRSLRTVNSARGRALN